VGLVIGPPYPIQVNPSIGWALVTLSRPRVELHDIRDDDVIAAARGHAYDWDRFADRLQLLLAAGWHVQGTGCLFVSRSMHASQILSSIDAVVGHGTPVEWCVADATGELVAIGGVVSGMPTPAQTFPGSAFPALVENTLTGAQRIVGTAGELRRAIQQELLCCADWWRQRPQELSDFDAHELVQELEHTAERMSLGPVPAHVGEELDIKDLFADAPETRISVRPVSGVVFAGLMEGTGAFSHLTIAPEAGLAGGLLARGQSLAADLEVAD
jgi:hypothetical protein